jgi:hypothetical protein
MQKSAVYATIPARNRVVRLADIALSTASSLARIALPRGLVTLLHNAFHSDDQDDKTESAGSISEQKAGSHSHVLIANAILYIADAFATEVLPKGEEQRPKGITAASAPASRPGIFLQVGPPR